MWFMRLLSSILLLCMWVCDAKVTKEKYVRISLHRQKTARENLINAPNLEHYGVDKNLALEKNITLALYRFLDSEFYGKVVVGSPGKEFNVVFDTTWTYSWLMSYQCDLEQVGCWFHNKYDHTRSSTYHADGSKFSMNEGKYNLTGFFSNDTFSIGQARVNNMSFIEMTEVSPLFIFNKMDGVLGLGLKFGDYNPFIYYLLKNKNITRALFSIYMNRDRQSNRGGDIYLGSIEPRHVYNKNLSSIVYLPVTSYAFWQFNIDKIIVSLDKNNKTEYCKNGCTAIADSSDNAIIGPKEAIKGLNVILKAKRLPVIGRYVVNCDTVMKLPKISFILGGKSFTLNGKQYIQKMAYAGLSVCMSAFSYSDSPAEQNVWVIGGAFLTEYYSVYDIDNKRIGFVKAA